MIVAGIAAAYVGYCLLVLAIYGFQNLDYKFVEVAFKPDYGPPSHAAVQAQLAKAADALHGLSGSASSLADQVRNQTLPGQSNTPGDRPLRGQTP